MKGQPSNERHGEHINLEEASEIGVLRQDGVSWLGSSSQHLEGISLLEDSLRTFATFCTFKGPNVQHLI
jgi:hypothetical protein